MRALFALAAALLACSAHAALRPTVRAAIAASQASLTTVHTSTADEALRVWSARRDAPPPTVIATAVRAWVQCEINAGVWPLLDFYTLPLDTAQASQLNLVGATYDLVAYNAPTFTPFHGFAGDGATSYMMIPTWFPSNGAGTMALNDAHIGLYIRTAATATTGYELYSGTGAVFKRSSSGRYIMTVNEGGTAYITPPSLTGHFVVVRSDPASHISYLAGASQGSASVASTGLIRQPYLLRTSTASYSNAEIGSVHAGRALTAAQVAADEQCRVNVYSALGAS